MCRRAECPNCDRPTFAGCGNHVEQVLGDVPPSERCQCTNDGSNASAPRAKRSWFGNRAITTR
jgi:hypothetical protein